MARGVHVVFDTDAGVDDAVALLLTLHGFAKEEVVGITTVFGNVGVQQADRNMAHILKEVGRDDVPIYSGAKGPIIARASDNQWEGHGPDGLGGLSGVIVDSKDAAYKNEAVQAIIDLSHKYAGTLVVIAVGPLTNLALAMLLDPSVSTNVKQIVVMGGTSRGRGNLTKHCEFNVGCDPEATEIVYKHCTADVLHVMPLETCLDNGLSWEVFDELFGPNAGFTGVLIRKIWGFTKNFCCKGHFEPYDAFAVALLLDPAYTKTARRFHGHVHLNYDEKRGANVWEDTDSSKANVTLVTQIDKEVFVRLLRELSGH